MMPDVLPVVAIDRRLGELVDDISVDYPLLVDSMRQRGFSDDEIAQTTITFHSDTPSTNITRDSGEEMIPTGSYDYVTRGIGFYPRNKIEDGLETDDLSREFSMAMVHELEHHAEEVLEGGRTLSRDEYMTIGKTAFKLLAAFPVLFAGIERGWNAALRLTDYEPGNMAHSIAALGSVAVASAGAFGIARPWRMTYDQYRASATEVRSYEAEQNAPANLVMIQPKKSLE